MKQITLNIPDKDYEFFVTLFKKFSSVKIKEADFVVPESHKELVRERRKTATKNDYIDWDEAKHIIGIWDMSYKIVIDRRAAEDIIRARDYYNERQKGLGKRFAKEVDKSIKNIVANPGIRYGTMMFAVSRYQSFRSWFTFR